MSPELYLKIEAVVISAVIAWGLVEWTKPLISSLKIEKKSAQAKIITRLVALIIGAFVGGVIYPELGGASWKLGAALGTCAGALNAVIISIVKKRIKGLNHADNTDK